MENAKAKQPHYRIDCPECHGTGRIKKYIGHPGRMAEFVCFACIEPNEK